MSLHICEHPVHYLSPDDQCDFATCLLCDVQVTGTELALRGIELETLRLPLSVVFKG